MNEYVSTCSENVAYRYNNENIGFCVCAYPFGVCYHYYVAQPNCPETFYNYILWHISAYKSNSSVFTRHYTRTICLW